MPVYSYRCENCGAKFDQTRKINDPPLIQCPVCGEPALRKVYTPVGIVFKGSGFYATDHRSPSGSNRADNKADHKTASDDKAAESKPAESTPASTTTSPPASSADSA